MRAVLMLAILCPLLNSCEPLSLSGQIRDERNAVVPEATLTVKRTGLSIAVDRDGSFCIPNLHNGDTIIASAAGYAPRMEVFEYTLYRQQRNITIVLHQAAAHHPPGSVAR